MKLLILTQKVNKHDPVLGFFHNWIVEFSKQCEKVTVIALHVGEHDFPSNVKVLSLGKEKKSSRLHRAYLFFKYSWRERKNYTHVFVHMNQIYVVLGGLMWKLLNKKIALWYVHKQVSLSLRIALLFANKVFTAAKESFAVASKKVHIVGHGIAIDDFLSHKPREKFNYKIVSVGRITPIKNLETLLQAVALLKDVCTISCDIIGPTTSQSDTQYLAKLKSLSTTLNINNSVSFKGPYSRIILKNNFESSDINVNLTPKGGIDKVVLEGILAGSIPLVSNTAFTSLFGEYAHDLMFEYGNAHDLANKIQALYKRSDLSHIRDFLQNKVKSEYDLQTLIKRLVELMAG